MSEYAREIAGGVTIAIIFAAIVGGVAIYSFPGSPGPPTVTVSTTSSATTVSGVTTSTTSGTITVTTTVFSSSSGTTTLSSLSTTTTGFCCYGSFEITSGSLVVNKSEAVLQLTLLEVGSMYIGSATVYINGTVIGIPPASPPASEYGPPGNILLNVQPGQQAVLVLTIPNTTIPIQVGRTYSIMVYVWLGVPGEGVSAGMPEYINVTAR